MDKTQLPPLSPTLWAGRQTGNRQQRLRVATSEGAPCMGSPGGRAWDKDLDASSDSGRWFHKVEWGRQALIWLTLWATGAWSCQDLSIPECASDRCQRSHGIDHERKAEDAVQAWKRSVSPKLRNQARLAEQTQSTQPAAQDPPVGSCRSIFSPEWKPSQRDPI